MNDSSADETPETPATKSAIDEKPSNLCTKAHGTAQEMKDRASDFEQKQRGHVADEVSVVSNALRKAAEEMRNGSPQERTMSQIASTLADASDSIRDKDLGEIAAGVSKFARRNPIAYLGGAALLGLAAARFAKAGSSDGPSGKAPETTLRPMAPTDTADASGARDLPTQPERAPVAPTPAYHRSEPEDI